MITLTKEQQAVHDSTVDWYTQNRCNYLTISGVAGTGKSTLIGFIVDTIKKQSEYISVAYVTYTGKASSVLRSKIDKLDFNDYVGTIHSLIYKPVIDATGQIIKWILRDSMPYSLIVLDEASMVGKEIWEDLLGYEIPIIAVGDSGQLPPIGKDNFSLMEDSNLKLEKIHRQALNNPIIKLSLHVRRNGCIPTKVFGPGVAKFNYDSNVPRDILYNYNFKTNSQILCGMNKTRVTLNNLVRGVHKYDDRCEPYAGEKLICLKNNKKINIMNGQTGYLVSASIKTDFLIDLNIIMDSHGDETITALSHKKAFGQTNYDICSKELYNEKILKGLDFVGKKPNINMFDFGYAISVHKSQGSEWDRIILIEERNQFQDDEQYARWLYTAITRASKKLIIISDFY